MTLRQTGDCGGFKLKRVCIYQWHMVAMEMTEYDICGICHCSYYLLSHYLANCDLQGMREQSMTIVAKRHTRVNHYLPFAYFHHTAQTTHT